MEANYRTRPGAFRRAAHRDGANARRLEYRAALLQRQFKWNHRILFWLIQPNIRFDFVAKDLLDLKLNQLDKIHVISLVDLLLVAARRLISSFQK